MSGAVSGARRAVFRLALAAAVSAVCLALVELGLRAAKSLRYDGRLHVSSPSANNRPHPRYGWIGPSSARRARRDPCYGRGTVSYNDQGFRAPPLSQAQGAWPIVCILGDSTMQGYQIPDGGHLPHLLDAELRRQGLRPYVLPLAVGGFGTLQQWMVYRDLCRPLAPTLVIHDWDDNDPINNDYAAERYAGPANNNARRRPYLQGGRVVYRRPYPIVIADAVDGLMLVKAANTVLLAWTARPRERNAAAIERGWRVARALLARLKADAGDPVGLASSDETRAIAMYRDLGFRVAMHDPFPAEETCAPRDTHPNTAGHRRMLRALLPVVRPALAERGQPPGARRAAP